MSNFEQLIRLAIDKLFKHLKTDEHQISKLDFNFRVFNDIKRNKTFKKDELIELIKKHEKNVDEELLTVEVKVNAVNGVYTLVIFTSPEDMKYDLRHNKLISTGGVA